MKNIQYTTDNIKQVKMVYQGIHCLRVLLLIFLFALSSNTNGQSRREMILPIKGEPQYIVGNVYTYYVEVGYDNLSINWSIGGGEIISRSTLESIIDVRWSEPRGGLTVDYSFTLNGEEIYGYSSLNLCAKANAGVDRVFCQSSSYPNLNTLGCSPVGGLWSGNYVNADGVISSNIPVGTYNFTYTTNPCSGFAATTDQVAITIWKVFNPPNVSQSIIYSCPGESKQVVASSSEGSLFRWYLFQNGQGSPYYTGSNFSYAPPDGNPHEFWVCVADQNCESTRTKVSFLPYPSDPISGGITSCSPATGTVLVSIGASNSIIRWEKSYNEGVKWDSIPNAPKTPSYNFSDTSSVLIRAIVKKGTCYTPSNSASITVKKSIGGVPIPIYTKNECSDVQGTITLGNSRNGEIIAWYTSVDKTNWKQIENINLNAPVAFHVQDTSRHYYADVKLESCPKTSSKVITIHAKAYAGIVNVISQLNCNTASGTLELTAKYGEVTRWEQTEAPDKIDSWTPISNSANTIYNFNYINKSTYFRAVVKLLNCVDSAYSSVASIVISSPANGVLERNEVASTCDSTKKPITFKGQFRLKEYSGRIVRWEKFDSGSWQPLDSTSGKVLYDYNITQTTKFRVRLEVNGCDDIYSGEATFYVNPYYKGSERKVSSTIKAYDGHSYITNGSIILSKGFKFHANSCQDFSITIDENYTLASSDMNFILVENINKEGVKDLEQVNWLNSYDKKSECNYLDGLGRPIQKVNRKTSPKEFDIVQPYTYDKFGRPEYEFLPYASNSKDGSFKNDFAIEQRGFYVKDGDAIANTLYPFAKKVFDGSPLNLVVEQGSPGTSWQPLPIEGGGKTTKTYYLTNTETDIKLWTIQDSLPVSYENYGDFQLLINVAIDERGYQVKEYVDQVEQTILRKVEGKGKNGETIWLNTYYIYDIYGNKRFVLPPEAVNRLEGNPTNSFLKLLAYSYEYDSKQRIIKRRDPGSEWTYIFYDEANRIRLTQNGVQRKSKEYVVIKYDDLGRTIMTSIWNDSLNRSRSEIQILLNSQTQWYEEKASIHHGYTLNKSFPTNILYNNILTVAYYDDYSFLNRGWFNGTGYSYIAELGNQSLSNSNVKGLLTGSKTKVLKSGQAKWLRGVNYYDNKYQAIQAIKENHIGGSDRITTAFDFSGKALKIVSTHIGYDEATYILKNEYTYDHIGRLLTKQHQVGNNPKVTMIQNGYNELGALIEKNIHGNSTGFLQSIDYRYHIRGWMSSINNVGLSTDGGISNDDATDLFGMELKYESNLILDPTTSQYNGNISEILWKNSKDNKLKGYSFVYDSFNRLKESKYKTFVNNSWTNSESGRFNEGIPEYDLNGNIISASRNGANAYVNSFSFGKIDSLQYYYKGNQLVGVKDIVPDIAMPPGFNAGDFSDGVTDNYKFDINNPLTYDYYYNENGSLYKDKNKGIDSISYNFYNLTQRVRMANGKYFVYTYDASGIKLSKVIYDSNGKGLDSTDYIGNFEYKGKLLQHILTGEGRITPNGTAFSYEYFITDHLGNLRIAFDKAPDGSARVIQTNDYYPFGMQHAGASFVSTTENLYKFNGKEDQKEWGVIDYGARMYDPALARWIVIDPKAEDYDLYSPYNYVVNNPLVFIDPTGMDVEETNRGYVYSGDDVLMVYNFLTSNSKNVYIALIQDKKLRDATNSELGKQIHGQWAVFGAKDLGEALALTSVYKKKSISNLVFESHGGFYTEGGTKTNILHVTATTSQNKYFKKSDVDKYIKGEGEPNKHVARFKTLMNKVEDGGNFIITGCLVSSDDSGLEFMQSIHNLGGKRFNLYTNRLFGRISMGWRDKSYNIYGIGVDGWLNAVEKQGDPTGWAAIVGGKIQYYNTIWINRDSGKPFEINKQFKKK